jgi:23S rRNA G2445 N2-methylase RlmL
VRAKGFKAKTVPGGVTLKSGWPDMWRANLQIRGGSRVIARIGGFRALHLAQFDKRARSFPWSDVLRRDVPFRLDAASNMRALAPIIQESHIDLIDRIDHGAGRRGFADETHFFEYPVGIRRTADGLLPLDVPAGPIAENPDAPL